MIYIRRFIIPYILYSLLLIMFVLLIPVEIVKIETIYCDPYLFLIHLLLYMFLFNIYGVKDIELYRFKSIKKCFLCKLKYISLLNIIIQITTFILILGLFFLLRIDIDIIHITKYLLNYIIIFEIVFLYYFYLDVYFKNIIKYILFFFVYILFIIWILSEYTLFNIFSSLSNNYSFFGCIINYVIWAIIPVLLYLFFLDRIEK